MGFGFRKRRHGEKKTGREIVPCAAPKLAQKNEDDLSNQSFKSVAPAGKLVTLVHIVMAACPGTPAGLLRMLHEREEEDEEPGPTLSAEAARAATSRSSSSSGFIVLLVKQCPFSPLCYFHPFYSLQRLPLPRPSGPGTTRLAADLPSLSSKLTAIPAAAKKNVAPGSPLSRTLPPPPPPLFRLGRVCSLSEGSKERLAAATASGDRAAPEKV